MATASFPSPPKKAEALIADAMDYHSQTIIAWKSENSNDRLEHWKALMYFWNLLPTRKQRGLDPDICLRKKMAVAVMLACHTNPYEVRRNHFPADSDSSDDSSVEQANGSDDEQWNTPMVRWGPFEWDRIKKKLCLLHELLVLEVGGTGNAPHNGDESSTLNFQRCSQRKFEDILGMIAANKSVSLFRQELEVGAQVGRTLLLDFR